MIDWRELQRVGEHMLLKARRLCEAKVCYAPAPIVPRVFLGHLDEDTAYGFRIEVRSSHIDYAYLEATPPVAMAPACARRRTSGRDNAQESSE